MDQRCLILACKLGFRKAWNSYVERIFWANRSVVMDDSPVESDRITRENLRNETIHKLMLFVNIRAVVHKRSGDHDKSASDARKITSSFRTELSMPTLSCRANSVRGRKRAHQEFPNGGWIPANSDWQFGWIHHAVLERGGRRCTDDGNIAKPERLHMRDCIRSYLWEL